MAPIKTLAAAILGLAMTATSLPAAAPSSSGAATSAAIEKCDPFEAVFYPDGACEKGVIREFDSMEPNQCFNIGAVSYGAWLFNIYNNRQGCEFKMWELPNCHGKATIQHDSLNCVPIANKDGQFYVTDGIQSVEVLCS